MSAFADNDFNSKNYDAFRPTYPVGFLKNILKYVNSHSLSSGSLRLIDIGTGPGTTIKTLIPLLPSNLPIHIMLTDISLPMLKQAKDSLINLPSNITIETIQCSGEELCSKISEPVDIIMAAECVHWINYDELLENCRKLLKTNGTLAYWVYVDPIFINNPKAKQMNEWYDDFVYESPDKLGSYWDSKGRNLLRKLLRGYNDSLLAHEGGEDWKDICVGYLVNNEFESYGNPMWCKNLLVIEKDADLVMFGNYIDTWSSSHKWNETHEIKSSECFLKGLEEHCGIKREEVVKWQMKSSFTFATRK